MRNKIRAFFEQIYDTEKDFKERMFILMTTIAIGSVFLAFVGDLITGEYEIETMGLGIMVFLSFIVAVLSVKYKKMKIGGVLIAMGIVFIALPVTFFFGGGLTGGSMLWVVVCYLYIGLLLEDLPRKIMLTLLTIVVVGEYYIAATGHYLIVEHSRRMWLVDTGISVLLVGIVVYTMVWFQNKLYKLETEKTVKQAKEIEDLNKAQNRFFSSMSHEIRTPINTIIGLNEMILRENASDEINENAANIQAASKMLLSLINDILDMSKFESGQMELSPVSYHTGDMLSDVVGLLWLKAKEKNLDFTIDVSPDLPESLLGDEVRIKQILINVLNNAIKYTREGSVRLQIQCERNGDMANVIYSVTDTGIGIKKESIPYLFTAFKRADEDKNRYIEGTGLGLSIVKQFVDLMGGKITVNSVYTKGTTFVIELPQRIVNDEHIGEIETKGGKGRFRTDYVESFEAPDAKVLVVDDTVANLLVVEKLLRGTRVQVDTAVSGKEALQKTFNSSYHVIFMDHLMPEMDGIECLNRIRTQNGGLCRESKIVALTANAGSDMEDYYEREGFDGYLLKPISGEKLEKALYRLLPKDIVIVTGTNEMLAEESMSWIREHQKKAATLITTESVADIPKALLEQYNIAVLPHMVTTPKGTFRDGLEIEARGLLSYMDSGLGEAETRAPGVEEHEAFFAEQLQKANNIIHISISSKVEHSGCIVAKEAAANFDNVFVVDSEHLSSGQGLMVIEAARLAASGMSTEDIIAHLEKMKKHVYTSFIVDTLDYLARANQIGPKVARMSNALMIHPVLALQKGKMVVYWIFFGTRERAWARYVNSAFRVPGRIDDNILFVTYVGMTQKELDEVERMIREQRNFKHIYFQKASPAIAVNCGPGTFGLLFYTRYDD